MYAVIYRGSIHPELEQKYLALWRQLTEYSISNRGAVGSCLHKTEQGEYIAYTRWPDKQTRDDCWGSGANLDADPEIVLAIEEFKKCVDRTKPFEGISMNMAQDLLDAR